jgi:replicative DNA helicase
MNDLTQLHLPASREAEQAVLGALLLDNQALDWIEGILSGKDFFSAGHRKAFEAAERLIFGGKAVDAITLADAVSGEKWEECRLSYLAQLAASTPSAKTVKHYAKIVRENAVRRELLALCMDTMDRAPHDEIAGILEDAERRIFDLRENRERSSSSLQALLSRVVERLDQRYHQDNPSNITGVPSGFLELDLMTAGLQPSDLIIIAGRPSMGKTTFAMNIAENIAVDEGLPVLVFSLEMSDMALTQKLLGARASIDQSALRTGRLTDDDWHRLTTAVGQLQDAPIRIEETGGLTIGELRARARRIYREYGKMGAIVIDYLGLMSVGNADNRAIAIGDITRGLKALAKELNVPVVCLSQLNRDTDKRANRRPVMSDLRDSGSIEQDADLILFLYRDEADSEDPLVELIVGKQRNGPTGTINLRFHKRLGRFENDDGMRPEAKPKTRGFRNDAIDYKSRSAGE